METEEKIEIGESKKVKLPQFIVLRDLEDKQWEKIKPILADGGLLLKANGWKKTHDGLHKAEAAEETLVSVRYDVKGYPLDVILALNKALTEIFGFTQALKEGFWGEKPPTRLSIKTGLRSETQAFAGMLAPPAWEGGYIAMGVKLDDPMALNVVGQLKKKFEASINAVIDRTKELVQTESIYRGKAVEMDFAFLRLLVAGKPFDPVMCAPKFIDVSKPPLLILPRHIQRKINLSLWGVIDNPEAYRKNKRSVKSGHIMTGPPGTGKTLTALHTMKKATENGWTAIKLTSPEFFVPAYDMAQFYAPCVLVTEDVEKIFGGPTTPFMDTILDKLDGVSTKGSEVITICTTNHPELINDKIRRSGRIGRRHEYSKYDGEAASRFIFETASEYLVDNIDLNPISPIFDGLVAADVAESIGVAKDIAISEHGADILGVITADMLEDAVKILREEKGLYGDRKITQEALNLSIVQIGERIKLGQEIPVEAWYAASQYFQETREKKAKGRTSDDTRTKTTVAREVPAIEDKS